MDRISLTFFLLFSITLAQNFDPQTGELLEDEFDPDTGEKIEKGINTLTDSVNYIPNIPKSTTPILHLNESDFQDLYNNETIYPAPPFYGTNITSNYYRARKGSHFINKKEIERELLKHPDSERLLKEHKQWYLNSLLGLVPMAITPFVMASTDNFPVSFLLFYGGLGFTIYSGNKYTNKWYKAIWVYNRENLKTQLDIYSN